MSKSATLSPEAIAAHFRTIHREYQSTYPDFIPFLEKHLFFVTATIRPGTSNVISPRQHPINEFGKFYFDVAKRLLGNRLSTKRRHQPLTYAFVDFEGTRSSSNVDVYHSQMPHIHALMLVRPQHVVRFEMIKPMAAILTPTSFDSIKIDQFVQERSSLDRLISYCMKGYAEAPRNFHGRDDLWAVFPK